MGNAVKRNYDSFRTSIQYTIHTSTRRAAEYRLQIAIVIGARYTFTLHRMRKMRNITINYLQQ